MTGLFILASQGVTPPVSAQPPPRTHVYIDGFNFYYGAVKGTAFKWLDYDKFLRLFRGQDDILKIFYFTALTDGSHLTRQKAYLSALGTSPRIEIVLGKFLHKNVTCRVTACTATCARIFRAPEEKRTDVNIAVQMVDDAYQDRCDQLILISGDSDLVPAIQNVKKRFPHKRVVVYVPSRGRTGHAYELRASADLAKDVPLHLLSKAQFPARVETAPGVFVDKPAEW